MNSQSAVQPARPASNAPYHPAPDSATYRDLLLFEERFKRNAEMLAKRSRRYSSEPPRPTQVQHLAKTGSSLPVDNLWRSPVHVSPFAGEPSYGRPKDPGDDDSPRLTLLQTYILLRLLQGSLAVDTITLCLFFASGMYEEKIRYAKR